ncbi:uncharacterized protein LOC132055193 [Lycium ferocissimum]|uniref:uncharacterized protein LOC132055193 n=1 Tax=Lycium ferocissimum TaxID=112874 RepID=UPI002815D18C|nr:uncharacterized protein LOC132055193 [Lycium ferocissimum]
MGHSKTNRHVRNKKKEQSFFNNLTDELLIQIFIRLPSSKEAIRCKLVCKHWLSLISSDYFVNTSVIHHQNNGKTLPPFTFVSSDGKFYVKYLLEFQPEKGLSRSVDLRFLYIYRPYRYRIRLKESWGDLILCSGRSSGIDYYICNIVTKQWIVLPPTPQEESHFPESEGAGFLIEPNCWYLVLRFIPLGDYKFSVQMFSSEQGNWTKLVVMSPRNLNILTRKTSIVACGRMLYTFTYKRSDVVDCVLAFDPFANDPAQFLCVIDFPLEACDIRCLACKLGVCRGRLRFAQLILQPSGYPCISIWELEDDYRMGKRTLVHKRIPTNTALRVCNDGILPRDSTKLVSVRAFHPYNEDLICFLVGNDQVVVYDIRKDKVVSSTLPSQFKHKRSQRLLPPDDRSLHLDVGPHHVLPITKNWWPTPVR